MEYNLRCNHLKCHASLSNEAVVTTCSHIFCLPCTESLGLSQSQLNVRQCPACKMALPKPDDVVKANLNPTEDYKTSVLSGLDPNTIMECAGRGLSFWSYQLAQEVYYQEYLSKNLTEKYGNLNTQVDKLVNDANAEIENLTNKVQSLELERNDIHKKNIELIELYREKQRKAAQTEELYTKLKRKVMMSRVHTAATDTANQTVNAISGLRSAGPSAGMSAREHQKYSIRPLQRYEDRFPVDQNGVEQLHSHQRSGSNSNHSAIDDSIAMPPPNRPSGVRTANLSNIAVTTPQHRTRLPQATSRPYPQLPTAGQHSQFFPSNAATNAATHRQQVNSNVYHRPSQGSPSGYGVGGISAGIKIGRPAERMVAGAHDRVGPFETGY